MNHVLELAKGKYILPCGDDLLHRDMISSLISVLEDENLDVIFSRTNVYENGEFKYIFPAEEHIVNFEKIKNNYESLLIKNILPAIGTIYKTEILRRIGGYDEDLKYEDLDMHIRLIQNKYKYFFHLNSYSDYFIRSTGYSKSHSYLISRQKVLVKYKHFQTFNLAYRQWLKSVFFQNSQLVKFVDFSEHPNLIFRYFFHPWTASVA